MSTLADLTTDLRGLAGLKKVTVTEAERLLNEGHRELCVRSEWTRANIALGPTVADQAAYTLPSTVHRPLKVKLDGTNAGIILMPDGTVAAQSRTKLLSVGDDNYGFAAWVEANKEAFDGVKRPSYPITIFGEWCGAGIQKRTAISKLDRKVFVAFAVATMTPGGAMLAVPHMVRSFLPENHPDMFTLPWHDCEVTLDFNDRESLKKAADIVNAAVDAVEKEDPWVKDEFDISGLGEGLVLYPKDAQPLPDFFDFEDLVWKAKGEKHKVVNQKKSAQVDPEVAKSIEDFADMFVTENRLNQALQVAFGEDETDVKGTGKFIKAISQDVKKESVAELEASGLTWRQVGKAVSTKARQWFLAKVGVRGE